MTATLIPCPFVHDDGRRCAGHIVSFAADKADLMWTLGQAGAWRLHLGQPRTRFRLSCSERGDHSYGGAPSEQMALESDQLPAPLLAVIWSSPDAED